ncbi:MAG: AraC family transcriptional regulator [Verrucomicrobia bacterium]|nr:AraC family transcriptional regulator [Prolixibacteraceae bacterium]
MNVKSNTQKYYHERINTVIQYIDSHLGENLAMETLAGIGFYSPFHFHRIMRAYLNEPLGSYITRLRLEYGAQLLRHSEEPVVGIAERVGYDNLSSFSKAFKKRFEIAPVEYRQRTIDLLKTYQTNIQENAMQYLKSIQPKIKTIKAKRLIYAQALGAYDESSKKAWEQVCGYAKEKHLFGFRTEFIGISFDDPTVTESEKLRYNACLTVSKEVKPEAEIGVMEVPEGKYAIFTHKGPYEQLNSSYNYIYGPWLAESKAELRNEPCLENYLNTPEKTKPEKLLTEIMIPIV